MTEELLRESEAQIDEIYARCHENAPNFAVRPEYLKASLRKTLNKYLMSASGEPVTSAEISEFLNQIQSDDLFMALACARFARLIANSVTN